MNTLNRVKTLEIVCMLVVFPPLVFSQENSKTTAPCSPIAPYNQGIIKIECTVDSQKTANKLIEILNVVQQSQLDLNLVVSKLDQVLAQTNAISMGFGEIKRKQEGRRLSEAEKEFLKTMVPSPTGQDPNQLIMCLMGNPESTSLAIDLVDVFHRAGWTIPGDGFGQGVFTGLPKGVIMTVHSKDDAIVPSVAKFGVALKQVGIDGHGEVDPKVPVGQFRILIGAQP